MKRLVLLIVTLLLPCTSHGGGSNYGFVPGARPELAGTVREWPVPTPRFARDPAIGPDGSVFVAVMNGNKVARFDPRSESFVEWDLPPGHRPHGLLVDRKGIVWTTGNGNGTIGRLDPATGAVTEFRTPSGGGGPHTLVISDDQRTIWFTLQAGNKLASLDVASGAITEYPSSGGPYGLALDREGRVWFCRMRDHRLGRFDPRSGEMAEVDTGAGTLPRRIAAAPDGMLWVTYYGTGQLAKVDPAAGRVVEVLELPGGDAGPYAVTVDGGGIVWANEIEHDTVVRLDPRSGEMRVIALPSRNAGIRKMVTDQHGRLWYMGSHNGRLGVVE